MIEAFSGPTEAGITCFNGTNSGISSDQAVTQITILFELVTFQIRKPLNHATVTPVNS